MHRLGAVLCCLGLVLAASCGCRHSIGKRTTTSSLVCAAPQLQIERPPDPEHCRETTQPERPILLSEQWPPEFRDLSLREAIQLTLQNSDVMRGLGGLVLNSPATLATTLDPAIDATDPRFGVDAALSAFDASMRASAFWDKNDRIVNNQIDGRGENLFQQDLGVYNLELSKQTAHGTILRLRHFWDYDFNNSGLNSIPNLPWTAQLSGEIRQPLLQGAGARFNRIAGPGNSIGVYNGVMIARVNSDVSLAEFESSVRDLVSTVENTYWELYFAYRDVDAKLEARKSALRLLKEVKTYQATGRPGGGRSQVAQAEEQYFRSNVDVEDAITGRLIEKSNANVFRGTGGILFQERRLRRIIGLAASDGKLLKPVTEPTMANTIFDWDEICQESLDRRVELRRQKWMVKRRELELLAAKNFLLPRMDALARYTFRGIGHDLLDPDRSSTTSFDNAYRNLTTGDQQEWGLGIELSVPLGYRAGHAAVRNASLRLSREKHILREQEEEVLSDVATAIGELDRAYLLMQTNFNRRTSASFLVESLEEELQRADGANRANVLSRLLDAQRKAADADSQYFRSRAEYAYAIKQIHYEKGSLLDYNEIILGEGPWPLAAHRDARERSAAQHTMPRLDAKVKDRPPVTTHGVYPQEIVRDDREPI